MYQTLIKGGHVIDGSGSPEAPLDIAIDGGKIVNLAPSITTKAHTTIDASGKIVSPGFIDAQNHSDHFWQLFDNPSLDGLTSQGITTALMGQCGASLAPILNAHSLLPTQKWHSVPGLNADWQTMGDFQKRINAQGLGTNMASLVGYETLRRSFTGDEMRELNGEERKSLLVQLETALLSGAAGVSFGLNYAHESSAPTHEIKEVTELVASKQKLVSVHLRSEGSHVLDAIEEVITLAMQTGARIKISHFKLRGQHNWQQQEHALQLLENAWHKKADLYVDVYPYSTSWRVLYNYLPHWASVHGRSYMLAQLKDNLQRRKILDYIRENNVRVGELILASNSSQLPGVGQSIASIARSLGLSSEETLLYLLEHGGSEVMVFDKNLNQENVNQLVMHPTTIIASDGAGFSLTNTQAHQLIHPRSFGSMTTFLREAIDSKALSLPQAIRKITGLPAKAIGLKDRGLLAIDSQADITIFDPLHIASHGSLENPYQRSNGIDHVFVHGDLVVSRGLTTTNRPGRFISL